MPDHVLGLTGLALLLAVFPTGCSSPEKSGAGNTLVIGITGEFDSLNELNAADSEALQVIQYMLFLSLTSLNEQLEFVPQLALRWEFSKGDSVLDYFMRRDVFWSDGVRTTPEDVVFTCHLAMNPSVAYPAASRFDNIVSVEAMNDSTVRFILKRPSADALADTQIPILPRHRLEGVAVESIATDSFNRKPIGNGRFSLVEWTSGQQIVFEAVDHHPLGSPKVERLVFRIVPDENTLFSSLISGGVDVVPAMTPVLFRQLQGQTSVQGFRTPGRNQVFVGWNMDRSLFSHNIRQALTCAVNKEEIINTVIEGFAEPVQGPLLPFVWAHDKNLQGLQFNPERSKTLLEREGWRDSDGDGYVDRNGVSFEFTLKTNAESQKRRDVAVMLQAQWKKVGVKVNIETVEWNLFLDQVFGRREFDAVLSAWDADFTVNPSPLWHSEAITSGYNFVGYRNDRVDVLLDLGRSAVNRQTALPVWHEFQRIIASDVPYTFLFSEEVLTAVSNRVKNVSIDVRSHLANIHEWEIE